jgi:hypothetical protein
VKTDAPMGEGGRWLEVVPPGCQTRLAVAKMAPGQKEDAQVGGFTRISFVTDDIQATYEELSSTLSNQAA